MLLFGGVCHCPWIWCWFPILWKGTRHIPGTCRCFWSALLRNFWNHNLKYSFFWKSRGFPYVASRQEARSLAKTIEPVWKVMNSFKKSGQLGNLPQISGLKIPKKTETTIKKKRVSLTLWRGILNIAGSLPKNSKKPPHIYIYIYLQIKTYHHFGVHFFCCRLWQSVSIDSAARPPCNQLKDRTLKIEIYFGVWRCMMHAFVSGKGDHV